MRTLAIILNLAIIVFFVLVLFTGNVALNEKFLHLPHCSLLLPL